MRKDAIGFFWQSASRKRTITGVRDLPPHPLVPDTGWTTPELPNLSGAKVIGLDTETYDPQLKEAGPGWARGVGHIVGVSLAVEDGSSWYLPIRHEMNKHMNLDPEQVMRYLRHTLGTDVPKVGANLIYDIGWLRWEGVDVKGKLYDIQFAEALLNSEEPDVSLENLAQRYLGVGKETPVLYKWIESWIGKTNNHGAYIYLAPPDLVGPYAEADAALPIQIFKQQWKKMHARGVLNVFDLECRLIRLLVEMRLKGAPVNIEVAEAAEKDLERRIAESEQRLYDLVGFAVNPDSSKDMKRAFALLGIDTPEKVDKTTGEVKMTFEAAQLKTMEHPFIEEVLRYKQMNKVLGTFIRGYILNKHINSRLYCNFHPLRGDSTGTRSGRFASSLPNLQNIPARTEEGMIVRNIFDGTLFGNRWRSFDYSSIEFRLLVNHAVGPRSDEVRAQFVNDPHTDYHNFVKDLIKRQVGLELSRRNTKGINFGIIYGMQLPSLADSLGLSKKEAQALLDQYHSAIPYASETMAACANEVNRTGTVATLLGRKSDFPLWEPSYREYGSPRETPLPFDQAVAKWGRWGITRAFTHKALNRKLQGGAADVMKLAMVTAYESGLFKEDACGVPVLTVHDELDFEDRGDLDNPAWSQLKEVMEHCADQYIRVPLIVDGGYADTWAGAH